MRFRLLTYNIHRAIGVDRRFRLERVVRVIRHYEPDVVLLQEVDCGVPRSRRLDLADEIAGALELPHVAKGMNVDLREGCYGNATISRYPLRESRNIDLTLRGRKARGCVYTEIVDDSLPPVRVFNLHLGLSARERERQAGILVREPDFPHLDGNGACIVAGDFNDWRSRLRPIFTDVFRFESATQLKSFYAMRTYPSFSPQGALDRIYYRGLKLRSVRTCRLRLSKVASDHLPIIADFEHRR